MDDGYKPISNTTAVRILNERIGCTLSPADLLWAEIDDVTKTIQFEDQIEGVWRIDANGRRQRRWIWSDEWTDWVDD